MAEKLISVAVIALLGVFLVGLLAQAEPKRVMTDRDVTALATEAAGHMTQFGSDCARMDMLVRDAEPIAGSPVAMSSCHIG